MDAAVSMMIVVAPGVPVVAMVAVGVTIAVVNVMSVMCSVTIPPGVPITGRACGRGAEKKTQDAERDQRMTYQGPSPSLVTTCAS
jgi:hypothetical protein